jgi:hypothetical protein
MPEVLLKGWDAAAGEYKKVVVTADGHVRVKKG